jgi:hypothetical protein
MFIFPQKHVEQYTPKIVLLLLHFATHRLPVENQLTDIIHHSFSNSIQQLAADVQQLNKCIVIATIINTVCGVMFCVIFIILF